MSERLVTNPHVLLRPHAYLDKPAFLATDPVTNETARIDDPRTLWFLDTATEPVERATLVDRATTAFGLDEPERVVGSLTDRNLLVTTTGTHAALADERRKWAREGWLAAFEYLLLVRDSLSDRTKPGEGDGTTADRVLDHDLPLYQTYPEANTVSLPDPSVSRFDAAVGDLLAGDPTGSAHLTAELLSSILYAVFGQVGEVFIHGVGPFVKKTSPSAGSWHPTELYLLTDGVDGLEDDLYHYSVADHALERLPTTAEISDIVASGGWDDADELPSDDPVVAVVYTARVDRNMIKYRDPRTFRIVQQDVGHLLETLRLVCQSVGRRTTTRVAVDARTLASLIGVDHLSEPVFGYGIVR